MLPEIVAKRRARPAVAILDGTYAVAYSGPEFAHVEAPELTAAARRIIDEDLPSLEVTSRAVTYVVRMARLRGADAMRYAMFVEVRAARRPLIDAYDRFGLSPREAEVLALIIDGASNREIADALCIAGGTVQDHVRSLCAKSGAKRRGDLLARVFGVDGG